jgi:hypothetical protein
MIAHYKGYEIKVTRERCLGGWDMLYYYIMRERDGWFCVDNFEDSAEKVRDMVGYLKQRIDYELASDDPWSELADRHHYGEVEV